MPKQRKTVKPRTGHAHIVNAQNPSPAPTSSRPAAVVNADNPQPAANQSAPAAPTVDATNPVPAAVQSTSTSTGS